MKKIVLLFSVFLILGCNNNPKKEPKLIDSLNNNSISFRGVINKIDNEFRLDYYDPYEKDSHSHFLQDKGYQGGGASWLGIIYGAIKLSDGSLLNKIKFDDEADGIAIWSKNRQTLEKISRLISTIKSDENLLLKSIKVAENNWKME